MTMATDVRTDELFGDMNGPLGYWGPVQAARFTSTAAFGRPAVRHDAECAALDRLAETVAGRTWAGTSMLMDAAFAQGGVTARPVALAAA